MDLERKQLNYCKNASNNSGDSSNNKNNDNIKDNIIASTSNNNNNNNNNNYKENQKNIYNNSQNDIECSSSISCNSVSSSSISSTTSPTSKIFNSSNNNSTSSNSNTSSQYNNNINSTINSNKRKRRSTIDDKDNELDNPTQPAKRQQIMPLSSAISSASKSSIISIASSSTSYYNNNHNNNQNDSQPSSVSSTYPSDDLPHEIDTRSCSSECLSTVAEYDIGTPSPDGEQTLVSPSMSHHQLDQYPTLLNSDENNTKWTRITEGCGRGDKTPHSEKERYVKSFIEFATDRSLTPTPETRPCPLPALSWANSTDVWNAMCRKDESAAKERHSTMLENHPGLQPRMRAILLDWLIEVCEVYKLHRETFYLAVDYLDRYLSTQRKVQKTHLQLIGITCLFVAAKVEEIYPPKIGEFAYVTDGACQEEDIINYELLLLSALNWNISPVTVMGWLGIYMQLNASSRTAASFINSSKNNNSHSNWNKGNVNNIVHNMNNNNNNNNINSNNTNNNNNNSSNLFKKVQDKNFINFKDINNIKNSFKDNSIYNNCNNNNNDGSTASTSSANNNTNLTVNDSGISITDGNNDDAFIYPQFSGFEFVQTAQIIDLCTLDLGLSDYPYSVIAAAAISHTFGRETAMRVSGYEWNFIAPCSKWMEPFFQIISEESQHLYLMEQNDQVQSKYGLGHICPNIVTDDSHIIQTHTTSMTMFDKALLRREQYQSSILAMIKQESSPAVTGSHHLCPEGLLTPPSSNRKPIDDENIENLPDLRNIKSSNIS